MESWLKEQRMDVFLKIILFLISPFFSFLYSLHRVNTKSSYLIFFLSSIFFGMSFTVESGKSFNVNQYDGQFYREKFEQYIYVSYIDFQQGLMDFLSFDDGGKDYYFDTIAFYLSRITDNYHYMFMVFAIIFSYFSLKSLKFLTNEENFKNTFVSYILLYLFTYNQIFNINGVRFWTAAWVAVYCVFQIYRNRKKIYLILSFITPFIHGSYWFFIGILLLASIFRSFTRFWSFMFILSFFISIFAVELLQEVKNYLPIFLSRSLDYYLSEEILNQGWSGFGWLSILFNKILIFYIAFLIIVLIKNESKILNNIKTRNLYQFLLIWVSIFNFLMIVPSLGSRFMQISYPIIAYIWLVNFKGKKYDYIILFLPFAFAYNIYMQIIYYRDVMDYFYYFSSPFYLVYKYLIL